MILKSFILKYIMYVAVLRPFLNILIFEYIETINLGSCKMVHLQSYLGWPLQ